MTDKISFSTRKKWEEETMKYLIPFMSHHDAIKGKVVILPVDLEEKEFKECVNSITLRRLFKNEREVLELVNETRIKDTGIKIRSNILKTINEDTSAHTYRAFVETAIHTLGKTISKFGISNSESSIIKLLNKNKQLHKKKFMESFNEALTFTVLSSKVDRVLSNENGAIKLLLKNNNKKMNLLITYGGFYDESNKIIYQDSSHIAQTLEEHLTKMLGPSKAWKQLKEAYVF